MVAAGTELHFKRSPTDFLKAARNPQPHYSPASKDAEYGSVRSDDIALHSPDSPLTGRYRCRTAGYTPHEVTATSLSVGRRYSPAPEESLGHVSRSIWSDATRLMALGAIRQS